MRFFECKNDLIISPDNIEVKVSLGDLNGSDEQLRSEIETVLAMAMKRSMIKYTHNKSPTNYVSKITRQQATHFLFITKKEVLWGASFIELQTDKILVQSPLISNTKVSGFQADHLTFGLNNESHVTAIRDDGDIWNKTPPRNNIEFAEQKVVTIDSVCQTSADNLRFNQKLLIHFNMDDLNQVKYKPIGTSSLNNNQINHSLCKKDENLENKVDILNDVLGNKIILINVENDDEKSFEFSLYNKNMLDYNFGELTYLKVDDYLKDNCYEFDICNLSNLSNLSVCIRSGELDVNKKDIEKKKIFIF